MNAISIDSSRVIIADSGARIRLTGEAYPSRTWRDSGECIAEWEANGEDEDGNSYFVRWRFCVEAGNESEPDNLDWDNADLITIAPV